MNYFMYTYIIITIARVIYYLELLLLQEKSLKINCAPFNDSILVLRLYKMFLHNSKYSVIILAPL